MPELLTILGAQHPAKRGGYVQATCPIHKGDNTSALNVYTDTCRWMCFTNGCHGSGNSASFFKLIQMVLGLDELGAVDWLASTLGVEDGEAREKMMIVEALRRPRRNKNTSIPESYLDNFVPDREVQDSYYERRGYSKHVLDYFDIRYCFSRQNMLYNRAIIPVRDVCGDLVGVTGRWMGKPGAAPKFLHSKGMQRRYILYNWHKAYRYFDCGYVIITESPGAVWGLHQIGRLNAVGTLGGNLSEEQVKIIASCSKVNTTVLCFDSDEAGRAFTERASKMLHGKTKIEIMELERGCDLDNINSGEFSRFFAARKNFISA